MKEAPKLSSMLLRDLIIALGAFGLVAFVLVLGPASLFGYQLRLVVIGPVAAICAAAFALWLTRRE